MKIRFTKVMKIEAGPTQVWEVFAHRFNDAYKWMASVPYSYAQSNGQLFEGAKSDGRVCELTTKPTGIKASEQFLSYDERLKTAIVKIDFIDTPGFFPVRFNTLDFSIRQLGEDQSEMTWKFTSHIKPFAFFMQPVLKKGFLTFVQQIMEELKHYVELGTPHPRKMKRIRKQGVSK